MYASGGMARKLGEERNMERSSASGPGETSLLLLLRPLPILRGREPDRARVSLALVLPVAGSSSPASSYSAPPLEVEPRLALNITPFVCTTVGVFVVLLGGPLQRAPAARVNGGSTRA